MARVAEHVPRRVTRATIRPRRQGAPADDQQSGGPGVRDDAPGGARPAADEQVRHAAARAHQRHAGQDEQERQHAGPPDTGRPGRSPGRTAAEPIVAGGLALDVIETTDSAGATERAPALGSVVAFARVCSVRSGMHEKILPMMRRRRLRRLLGGDYDASSAASSSSPSSSSSEGFGALGWLGWGSSNSSLSSSSSCSSCPSLPSSSSSPSS